MSTAATGRPSPILGTREPGSRLLRKDALEIVATDAPHFSPLLNPHILSKASWLIQAQAGFSRFEK